MTLPATLTTTLLLATLPALLHACDCAPSRLITFEDLARTASAEGRYAAHVVVTATTKDPEERLWTAEYAVLELLAGCLPETTLRSTYTGFSCVTGVTANVEVGDELVVFNYTSAAPDASPLVCEFTTRLIPVEPEGTYGWGDYQRPLNDLRWDLSCAGGGGTQLAPIPALRGQPIQFLSDGAPLTQDRPYEIFDAAGRPVASGRGTEIPTDELPSGVYVAFLGAGLQYRFCIQ